MADADTTQSVPDAITSSLSAVWQRYTTKRPAGATTVIKGNVVRCVMPDSAEDFAAGLEMGEDDEDPKGRLLAYRREAVRAVSRATEARVLAQVSKHDADTDVATEIFVLDISPKRSSFGEPDWIAS